MVQFYVFEFLQFIPVVSFYSVLFLLFYIYISKNNDIPNK